MVRVSWGGEVVISDIAPDPENECSGNAPVQSSSSLPSTPTVTPTSSNTPTTATSPSYSSPSTISPHPSTLNSPSSRPNSKAESNLFEELKSDLFFLKVDTIKEEEMMPLKDDHIKYSDDDNNNSRSEAKDDIEKVMSSLGSSAESIIETLDDTLDPLIIQKPLRKAAKMEQTSSSKSSTKDELLTRMLATLSDFEDDLEPIDGVVSESSESGDLNSERQILFDVSISIFKRNRFV